MFRSLRVPSYRWWFIALLISNTGTWMQRTAQDWVVLTELTDGDGLALGISTALQFGPLLFLTPLGGMLADRIDKRTLLLCSQSAQALLALGLGLLLTLGTAQLWHLYLFALLLGIASSIDIPARQSFVSELVEGQYLANAIALNSTSFQAARLLGPAVAGLLVATAGAGPVFFVNTVSFGAVIAVLLVIRRVNPDPPAAGTHAWRQFVEGLRHVRSRGDLIIVMVVVFIVCAFSINLPIYVALMTTEEFGLGATGFGLFSSVLAVGAVTGSLLAARQRTVRLGAIVLSVLGFSAASAYLALAPDVWQFGFALVLVGIGAMFMSVLANAYVQLTAGPGMRGRVLGIFLALYSGAIPIGAPIIGMVSNAFGPRWAVGLATVAGLLAAGIAITWLITRRGMRLTRVPRSRTRFRLEFSEPGIDPTVDTDPDEDRRD